MQIKNSKSTRFNFDYSDDVFLMKYHRYNELVFKVCKSVSEIKELSGLEDYLSPYEVSDIRTNNSSIISKVLCMHCNCQYDMDKGLVHCTECGAPLDYRNKIDIR